MTSAGLDWKHNPIAKIHVSCGIEFRPEISKWIEWEDGCKGAFQVVGVLYVCKMMQAMYRSQDVIQHFVDMGAISDFDGGMNYQQIEIHDDRRTSDVATWGGAR